MNELEKYKKSLMIPNDIFKDTLEEQQDIGINYGFDAAIALDLPIKFTDWMAVNGIKVDGKKDEQITWMKYVGSTHTNQGTTKELYKYWIDNIYKFE